MWFSSLDNSVAISLSGCSVSTGMCVRGYELGLLFLLLLGSLWGQWLLSVSWLLGTTGLLSLPVIFLSFHDSLFFCSRHPHPFHVPCTDSQSPSPIPVLHLTRTTESVHCVFCFVLHCLRFYFKISRFSLSLRASDLLGLSTLRLVSLGIPAVFVLNVSPSVDLSSYPRLFFSVCPSAVPRGLVLTPQGWKNARDQPSTLTSLEKLGCDQPHRGISWDKELPCFWPTERHSPLRHESWHPPLPILWMTCKAKLTHRI